MLTVTLVVLLATAILFSGLFAAMATAIVIAVKLEPGQAHLDRGDQIDALKNLAFIPALLTALGFGFLAWAIAFASLQPSP